MEAAVMKGNVIVSGQEWLAARKNFCNRKRRSPERGTNYNFTTQSFNGDEAPGISVFVRDKTGEVYHTYSCYSRGLDMLNGAYHHLDLVPKDRDEADLPWPMAWVKRHDRYAID
jgi:predicted dithiol-disulfide oxidoreductase (DUF899 family)